MVHCEYVLVLCRDSEQLISEQLSSMEDSDTDTFDEDQVCAMQMSSHG